MRPDPDMMSQALSRSANALEAIGRFQVRTGFQFGRDATHASAYRHVRDLADALSDASAKLNAIAMDADERLTPAARMRK